MLSSPQRAGEILKSIKKRLTGVSGKTSNKITQSHLVSNLKRAIQSTPDLLKTQDGPYGSFSPPSLSQERFEEFPSLGPTQACASKSLGMDYVLSSPAAMQSSFSQDQVKPMPSEEVLFSPPKDAAKSARAKKIKLKYVLGKKRLPTDSRGVGDAAFNLPMITLTTPDDEQLYVLHRPTPPITSHTFLAVPNRAYVMKNIPELPRVSAKKWPHPAGPWLRPTTSEEQVFQTNTGQLTWQEGWRLGTGTVIGWDPECMEAMGIAFPPQLPTEKDLERLALVEQISRSLDQADAHYGSLENEWEPENDEDDDEMKFMEAAFDFPACVQLPHEVHQAVAI